MEHLLRKLHLYPTTFGVLYAAYFLYSVHLFLVLYVNSTFLSSVVGQSLVGALYVVGSALAITTLLGFSKILQRIGNYRGLVLFVTAEILSLLGLATTESPSLVVLLFVAHCMLFPLVLYNLDIFIESSTTNEASTGSVRSMLLTVMSVALICAPFLAGVLVGEQGSYGRVYLLSATVLIPFLGLIALKFRRFLDPRYQHGRIIEHLRLLSTKRTIWDALSTNLILRIFFATMVVYLPLYLSGAAGFSWPQIGIILAVMLLPHALFSIPLGVAAKDGAAAKPILVGGFLLLAGTLTAMSVMEATNILAWMAVLFLMRLGATAVEIVTETQFFQCVSGDDAETIGIFRVLRPCSYLIGLTAATVFLAFLELRFLFVGLAAVMIAGAYLGAYEPLGSQRQPRATARH